LIASRGLGASAAEMRSLVTRCAANVRRPMEVDETKKILVAVGEDKLVAVAFLDAVADIEDEGSAELHLLNISYRDHKTAIELDS
jgi:hypothetical protein